MLSDAELHARLQLHCLPELGTRRFHALLSAFGSAAAALSAPASAWRSLGLPSSCADGRRSEAVLARVRLSLNWLQGADRHLVLWDEPTYPGLLGEITDAPPLLFVAGDPSQLERPQLAIVGSRRASQPGLDTARHFAAALARGGFVITSGLALGIDGAAHRATLEAGGQTVAVLGTGLQHLYPSRHVPLAQDILAHGGALVSEFPLDSPPQASNFPRRNRIISGLALGVLVVEASQSSGSLITARLAAEQGREVYAIPGSIHHPGAKGCHQLLREGATLVETLEDILQSLRGWHAIVQNAAPPPALSGLAEHPLLALLHAAPHSSEALASASGWPLPEVLAALTELELGGQVANECGVWVGRRR
jgi:DNA processing protein